MAQFDVHRNLGQSRDSVPFVVIVQSSVFDDYRRRVVVPLVKKSHLGEVHHPRFNPMFTIGRLPVVLHPLEIVSVPADRLGKCVGTLAKESDRIIDALDELITRAHD
ncbi:MAG: CcdB family protein [Steroidobacteraceae bacterium]|nr:CcdB family protein [Steroidobacteraceae bacterium]MCW5572034.1 CcdB family protein [Steroidobacteraceae bacterium]